MPFRDPAWGLCYKETFSYKCWELGLQGQVRGTWIVSTWSQNKCLRSERCNQASGLLCLHNTKMPGWPDVFYQPWSQRKETRKDHGEITQWGGGSQRARTGEGRTCPGSQDQGRDRAKSDARHQPRFEGFSQTNGGDPNVAFSWSRRSHWVVRFSE